MSRIANYPVIVPDKVEVTLGHDEISVKGPLGTLTQKLTPGSRSSASRTGSSSR